MYHNRILLIIGLLANLLIAGCSGSFTPYRIEIRQGNYITASMADNVKEGMTKDQVRFSLGMPLLQDIFHRSRWDFVYHYSPGKFGRQKHDTRALTIFFDEGGLVKEVKRWDDLPTDRPPVLIVLEPTGKVEDKKADAATAEATEANATAVENKTVDTTIVDNEPSEITQTALPAATESSTITTEAVVPEQPAYAK